MAPKNKQIDDHGSWEKPAVDEDETKMYRQIDKKVSTNRQNGKVLSQ